MLLVVAVGYAGRGGGYWLISGQSPDGSEPSGGTGGSAAGAAPSSAAQPSSS